MLFRYVPFTETLRSAEIGEYTSFGIRVINHKNEIVLSVSDVSVNYGFVCDLCRICNLCHLDPLHLPDVIEDRI